MGSNLNGFDDAIDLAGFDWRWGLPYLRPAHAAGGAARGAARMVADHDGSGTPPSGARLAIRTPAPWGWKHPHSYLMLPFLGERHRGLGSYTWCATAATWRSRRTSNSSSLRAAGAGGRPAGLLRRMAGCALPRTGRGPTGGGGGWSPPSRQALPVPAVRGPLRGAGRRRRLAWSTSPEEDAVDEALIAETAAEVSPRPPSAAGACGGARGEGSHRRGRPALRVFGYPIGLRRASAGTGVFVVGMHRSGTSATALDW